MKTAILLINVGTPDQPAKKAVKAFLREFLCDPRVIDLPWFWRILLVRGIILPFRLKKSTRLYQRLWTREGSPLLVHLKNLAKELNNCLPADIKVYYAMRYGNPSLLTALNQIRKEKTEELVLFPLYPQYASSTTQSAEDEVRDLLIKSGDHIKIKTITQFYSHPSFIRAFVLRIQEYDPSGFDHVLFSFHGLPLSHIRKIHPANDERICICEHQMPEHGNNCYKAACYDTARTIAEKLGIPPSRWSVSFQSRMNRNWISPFTDQVLISMAAQGKRRILVVAPSFVADCLETLIEIKQVDRDLFKSHGGEELVLVESLNEHPEWVKAASEILLPFLKKG